MRPCSVEQFDKSKVTTPAGRRPTGAPMRTTLALTLALTLAACGQQFPQDTGGPSAASSTAPRRHHVDTIQNGSWNVDNDGDGYSEAQGDCDDGWRGTNPGHNDEWRDGMDNDCDGYVDEGCRGVGHNQRC